MKNTVMTLVLLSSSLLALDPVLSQAAEYSVDPAHSHVGFVVRHMLGKVPGEFKDFEGTFQFDEKKPSLSAADFTIKSASISTDNPKRDTHLKSGDFFDAEKYPTLTFKSKKLVPAGHHKYKLMGDLTMHGITHPVTFAVEYMGSMKDPWGSTRASFTANTKVNRKDFNILWNKKLDSGSWLIGDDVMINLDIEAVKK